MKTCILLCLCLCLIAGCIGNSLEWTVYKDGKPEKKLKINNLKGAVNTQTKTLAMSVKDGNDFSANILVMDSNVAASPESATAIGSAITEVMTGGASKIGENLSKGK
jgi:hypothetical protein